MTEIKLVVISDELIRLDEPIVLDILRVLNLRSSQVTSLMRDQIETLVSLPKSSCKWSLGIDTGSLPGPILKSPRLDDLAKDRSAKKDLWQQICHQNLISVSFLK